MANEEMFERMWDDRNSRGTIPYSSWQKQLELIRRHGHEGSIPGIFTPDVFGNVSKGTVAAERGSLKALGLLDDSWVPTQVYFRLADADEDERRMIYNRIGRSIYPEMIDLAERHGTHEQLERLFEERGITGSTLAKAISFYMNLSEYAGLPWSPHFVRPRGTSANHRIFFTNLSSEAAEDVELTVNPNFKQSPSKELAHRSEPEPGSLGEFKKQMIKLLLKAAENEIERGESANETFDRLERLLGTRE